MSIVWGALRYEINDGVGANAAFLGEISEIVLILDKQSSVQDVLSLCLADHLQEAERGQPKPSHKEVSTSHDVAFFWSSWAGIAILCFPREEEEVMGLTGLA